ncbi:MAG: TIGR02466 family protein [Paracoccaceae bacterium]|nr:TIGR02466 family protein [Paracoccaceae bacterium]
MRLTEQRYFSTPIFISELEDAAALNPALIDAVRARRTFDAGQSASNVPALGSWHSSVDLHLVEAFKPIVEVIGDAATRTAKSLALDPRAPLGIDAMWAIVNPPGSYNRSHIHPRSILSGVYYLQTPPKSGALEFTDPRTQALVNPPLLSEEAQANAQLWSRVTLEPVAGRLVLFPAWLYHSVNVNLTELSGAEADRIILSFNLSQLVTPAFRQA